MTYCGENGQIPDTKRAVIPQNPADGRRLNVTVTGHFGAQRERARAEPRAGLNEVRARLARKTSDLT